jgi:hypothetical protein
MMCLLCGKNEATKSNTHYLTDSIIRTALNPGGGNKSRTGLYWQFSTEKAGLKFGFQQSTFDLKLEETLGRIPTAEEIAEAVGTTAFSVDNHFCPPCETHFGEIEKPFYDNILPMFRGTELTGVKELDIEDVRSFRAFFLLQALRSALCDETFTLSDEVVTDLRHLILNFQTVDVTEFTKYPLSVTYLQTTGGPATYTENQVGFAVNEESQIILMNDFIIQFFETPNDVTCVDFSGLNDPANFDDYLNLGEDVFNLKILSNEQRRAFLYPDENIFSSRMTAYFQARHIRRFRQFASSKMVEHFKCLLSDETVDIPDGVRYGEERLEVISNTILDRIAKETAKHRTWRR